MRISSGSLVKTFAIWCLGLGLTSAIRVRRQSSLATEERVAPQNNYLRRASMLNVHELVRNESFSLPVVTTNKTSGKQVAINLSGDRKQRKLLTQINFPSGGSLSSDINFPNEGTLIPVSSDSCEAQVTVQARAASPGGDPDVTYIYVVDKSGSTDNKCPNEKSVEKCLKTDSCGPNCLEAEIIKFFDRFTDEVIQYPSTKNFGVVTFADEVDGADITKIRTPTLTSDLAVLENSYDADIRSDAATCCRCALRLVRQLLTNNESLVGRQITLIFLSDGICNRPKDNPDDRAAATAQRLVDDFGVKIIKVAVGNVDCAEVNGAIPLGPCYESSNPKDLNLNDIVGTKLINGTIEIDNNVQGTTFPATVPEFTAGLKQQDFDWTGNLGPGTYDVYATTFGQNANSYLPQSVTDEEIALFSVVDQTLPQISCPGNIEVASTKASCQEVVTYSIQSDDNCPSSTLVQTAGNPSGATFDEGTTSNTFEITDSSGNTASCSFDVTVSCAPTSSPTASPTSSPTPSPTASPSSFPTTSPTTSPSSSPTAFPTASPTGSPTASPTSAPTTIQKVETQPPTSSPTAPPTCPYGGAAGSNPIQVAIDKKCPTGSDRLFRTANDDPLTLEECNQLCFDTADCEWFSLGEDDNKLSQDGFLGVCIGCKGEQPNSDQPGFNVYAVDPCTIHATDSPTPNPTTSPTTSPSSSPTDAPTSSPTGAPTCPSGEPGGPVLVSEDCKCGDDRLFRTANTKPGKDPMTFEECNQLCQETDGCEFFSFGEDDEELSPGLFGVCIGCPGPDIPDQYQNGFNVYEINACETSSPTISPTPPPTSSPTNSPTDAPTCPSGEPGGPVLVSEDCKCGDDRLFRTTDAKPGKDPMTFEDCNQLCLDTDGCEFFSFGEDDSELPPHHVGVCIGCPGPDVPAVYHNGFNVYEINSC